MCRSKLFKNFFAKDKHSKEDVKKADGEFVRRVEKAIAESPELYERYKEMVKMHPGMNRNTLVQTFVNWNVKRSFKEPISVRIHAAVLGITEEEMHKIFVHDGDE